MANYKKMYLLLFNSITNALRELENLNIGTAKRLLQTSQQQTEELFVSAEQEPKKR